MSFAQNLLKSNAWMRIIRSGKAYCEKQLAVIIGANCSLEIFS
jgi:hypothetical protein